VWSRADKPEGGQVLPFVEYERSELQLLISVTRAVVISRVD